MTEPERLREALQRALWALVGVHNDLRAMNLSQSLSQQIEVEIKAAQEALDAPRKEA